ncbi:MAG: NAD(P)/FAD-dependent oxidoreductase [Cyanobacteria bacterium SZAS LIN-3]|nr:NAD(P)/FAD-dependent oxidoreductase [Cyanobacteria bacterium SZAS LIN-3]
MQNSASSKEHPTDKLYDVVIIGAGLAGLNCALTLQERGFSALLLEAQDDIGGRVRTDNVDGFLLDRGFQVFLTAYPEAARRLDYRKLDLQAFLSGALIHTNGRFIRLTDPFREPLAFVPMLASDIAPLTDKVKVAFLRQRLMSTTLPQVFKEKDRPIEEKLTADCGFSQTIVERFFRPFFGGITLDKTLSGSSRMFEFVYKMMAEGSVVVPRKGMGAITRQMAEGIAPGDIRLETRVKAIDRKNCQVELESGEIIKTRAIVVATEGPEAHRLVPEIEKPASRHATCLYFSAPKAPLDEAILVLNGDGDGPVNNLAVMSNVSSEYAPAGQSLISLTVLGETGPIDDQRLSESVLKQMHNWFGDQVNDWKLLKIYRIHHAQPDQTPPWLAEPSRSVRLNSGKDNNIYVCGDHRENASINGALASGRKAALAICEDLKVAMA